MVWRAAVEFLLVALPRFDGQPDYAASAATWAFSSNSIGLT